MTAPWDCRTVGDPLSDAQRAKLGAFLAAKTRADATQREHFLNATGAWLAMADEVAERRPLAITRDTLARLAKACKRVEQRLRDLGDDLPTRVEPWFENLLWLSEAPRAVPPRFRQARPALADFLADTRDHLALLHALADYAEGQLEPDATARPRLWNSKFLARRLAESFEEITGERVPVSKLTWFPDYAGEVCELAGFQRLDADTIRALLRPGE